MIRAATALWVWIGAQGLGAQLPQPPLAEDHNEDASVFETVITATERPVEFVPGKKTKAMAFNGSVPGPTIIARLGDTLIVHFVNMLSEPTVLHWHGVATPATMDGSQISQVHVPKSGYHRYEFKLSVAGTFWYHPHVNTNEQIEKGLYGALIVRDLRHDAALKVDAADERVVFLDDVKLDDGFRIAPFATDLAAGFVPWQRAEDLANSRIGNHLLVNGRAVTKDIVPTLEVEAGTPYRLRLISASSGHIFRLDLGKGKTRSRLYAVGSDQGLWNTLEAVRPIDEVINKLGHHNELISNPDPALGVTLTPADRMELVLVPMGDVNEEFTIRSHDFIKGKHTAYRDPEGNLLFGHDHFDGAEKPRPLIKVRIVGRASAEHPWSPPATLRWDPVPKLVPDSKLPPLPVFFGHSPPNRDDGNVMFFLKVGKAEALSRAVLARKPVLPADFDPRPMMKQRAGDGYEVRVGEVRLWEVLNFTGNDHNFHVHGFRFQHVETEYIDLDEKENNRKEEPERVAFEDTIRVPKRAGLTLGRSYTIVRLAMRFDDKDLPAGLRRPPEQMLAGGLSPGATTSGGWLVHCHFLEHAAKGMMSFITVKR